MEFWEFATLISCHDYRALADHKEASVYMARLRRYYVEGRVFAMHLAYVSPLGVGAIAATKHDESLWLSIAKAQKVTAGLLGRLGVPKAYFVSRVVLVPGDVVVLYYKPPGISFNDVYGWADDVAEGVLVPIQTCNVGGEPRVLGRRLEELLKTGVVKLKTYVLALVLLSLLDKYRLLPIRRVITSIMAVARARDVAQIFAEAEIRYRYVKRYLDKLSRHNVLVRFRVTRSHEQTGKQRYFVETEPRAAQMLYGMLAMTGSAGHMFYSRTKVMVAALLDEKAVAGILELAGPLTTNIRPAVRVVGAPFPYEMYDPIENRWVENPNNSIIALLRKIGVVKPTSGN